MKSLVVYDSNFGNTETIARAIAGALSSKARHVAQVTPEDLRDIDLLVVGSPINAWQATPAIRNFIKDCAGKLKGVAAAAFDTRVKLWISGNAAGKMTRSLREAGARILSEPRFFYVKDTEGPLAPGESEEAAAWGRELKSLWRALTKFSKPLRQVRV
jgi:flavodoxin